MDLYPMRLLLVLFILSTSALFLVSLNPPPSQNRLQSLISQCEELRNYQDTVK